MWDWLLESMAEVAGVTRRARPWVVFLVAVLGLWLCVIAFVEGGPRGLLALAALLMLVFGAAFQVLRARASLWNAARLPLTDPRQRPDRAALDLPPTARAVATLAVALDDARRGAFLDAAQALEEVERARLRLDEERLYEAARALVSLGLGDPGRAAAQASRALPTGCDDLDFVLGRMMVAEAWSDASALRRIDDAWATEGIAPGTKQPLPRLRAIVRLRIDTSTIEGLETWEARALADEARAVGDDALAADLEARARPTAYR